MYLKSFISKVLRYFSMNPHINDNDQLTIWGIKLTKDTNLEEDDLCLTDDEC